MSPDHISIISSILSLLNKMGGWSVGLVASITLIVMIGPWLLSLHLAFSERQRFEAVVRMYENNVDLLKTTQNLAQDLKEIIITNIQGMTKIMHEMETNQYCPMMRLEKRAPGPVAHHPMSGPVSEDGR
ncbi:hypothetical protein [Desulfatiglans anilini]|uniref:hypothetical protein n=1 Tax=Desulfatiglans anilini TaxID=90728 RepID=UPI000429F2D2|nr:hypothetical protein [Desulfatiglans anilini]